MTAAEALRDRYAPKVPRLSASEEARLLEIAARGVEIEDEEEEGDRT